MNTSFSADSYDPHGLIAHTDQTHPQSGCHALVAALLDDVFLCRETRSTSKRAFKQWQQDARWIASERDEPFSFIWCCEHLNLDPAVVRTAYVTGRVVFTTDPQHRVL
jgi:hypothetical protein